MDGYGYLNEMVVEPDLQVRFTRGARYKPIADQPGHVRISHCELSAIGYVVCYLLVIHRDDDKALTVDNRVELDARRIRHQLAHFGTQRIGRQAPRQQRAAGKSDECSGRV